jgi:hypothetical protein
VIVLPKAHDYETGVPYEYEARTRIPGTYQITSTPDYHGDLHHPVHRDVLPARPKHEASSLFGWRKGLLPESALEIEDRCAHSMAAVSISAVQLLEYTSQSPVYLGAQEPLNALKHPRPTRSKWRFPLFGLFCAVLPFTIFAWGTAYKLSLYKTDKGGAPAKVCTRGSDAAESSVSQAIDRHKAIGNGIAPSPLANFSILLRGRHDVALSETCQIVLSLQSGPILAGRPPPKRGLFSS